MKITVLGAGAWGCALANHIAQQHATLLWARASSAADLMQRLHKTPYLPECILHPNLHYTHRLETALAYACNEEDLCIIAVPISGLRFLYQAIKQSAIQPRQFVCLSKGLEVESALLPHQIFNSVFSNEGFFRYGVLSGPSFAKEVALGLPTAISAASIEPKLLHAMLDACHHGNLRIYTHSDLIGAEIGGAVKNVLAIAAGISDGLQLGLNARAALLTRGLLEMTQLGVALGAHEKTFMGLSSLGDLILTATGDLSRNRLVGLQLAQGKALEAILISLQHVAEGVHCARAVQQLANRYQVEMPITDAVCQILFDHQDPQQIAQALLNRAPALEYSQ